MKTKLNNWTIIIGTTLSYLVLGYSNYQFSIKQIEDVSVLESIGYSLFQFSHMILFMNIYLNNKNEKFNNFLLIPIIIQLVDLVPIEILHSLKFSLVSILSIIIGWITVTLNLYPKGQKRIVGVIIVGIISLIITWFPSVTLLNSIDNPNGDLYKIGLDIFRFDHFFLFGKFQIFYQSISNTIYYLSVIYLTIVITQKNQTTYYE